MPKVQPPKSKNYENSRSLLILMSLCRLKRSISNSPAKINRISGKGRKPKVIVQKIQGITNISKTTRSSKEIGKESFKDRTQT